MSLNLLSKTVIFTIFLATFTFPKVSIDELQVGGTYKMILITGDVLEGVLYSKTDTNIIIDCQDKPYSFEPSLISEYQLISLPSKIQTSKDLSGPISYEQLMQIKSGISISVKIKSGAVFNGVLSKCDEEQLEIDAGGSVIPIARNIIEQISIISKPKEQSTKQDTIKNVVYDTIIVKNPETDDYGRPKENLTIIGKIIKEDNIRLTLEKPDKKTVSFTFDQIVRIFRHTPQNPEEERIKNYAKPLFCPNDMVLIDMPPGKANRPFFKVCIDKYEYPNTFGKVPVVNISFEEAQKICEKQGKRLCTWEEWQWACSGLEGFAYPYGINLEKENCNTEGTRIIEPSGSRNKCISKFGVLDMTGNVFEWVKDKNNLPAAMGGPLSKCPTISPGGSGDAKPTIGFRCCKSN